ncbi:MAG: ATP-binding protein [Terriglobales bacterium]
MLLNLALNAFRFMPGGGWLSIRGSDSGGDNLEIAVRDTGPGMAADDLPRIFDVGFSTRPGSSGLGLAVCHRILEQHGGTIEAESRPGHGATFRLRLPRSGTAASDGTASSSFESPEGSPEFAAQPAAGSGLGR